jgi:hypothetical protein
MFKYLIPLLLVSTVAYADGTSDPFKLHHHFNSVIAPWDASNIAPAFVPPPAPTVDAALGKCSKDALEDVSAYLHAGGYTALLIATDKNKPDITQEIMYNSKDNSIINVSLYHDHAINMTEDKDKNPLTKICIGYVGTNVNADGPAFKSLILGLRMDLSNKALDEIDTEKRKLSTDTDNPHSEPYQGDPSKINYIR